MADADREEGTERQFCATSELDTEARLRAFNESIGSSFSSRWDVSEMELREGGRVESSPPPHPEVSASDAFSDPSISPSLSLFSPSLSPLSSLPESARNLPKWRAL